MITAPPAASFRPLFLMREIIKPVSLLTGFLLLQTTGKKCVKKLSSAFLLFYEECTHLT